MLLLPGITLSFAVHERLLREKARRGAADGNGLLFLAAHALVVASNCVFQEWRGFHPHRLLQIALAIMTSLRAVSQE